MYRTLCIYSNRRHIVMALLASQPTTNTNIREMSCLQKRLRNFEYSYLDKV